MRTMKEKKQLKYAHTHKLVIVKLTSVLNLSLTRQQVHEQFAAPGQQQRLRFPKVDMQPWSEEAEGKCFSSNYEH